MDNLNITTENNYFDINGILIIRGVDKLDCWELKKLFKRGQHTMI